MAEASHHRLLQLPRSPNQLGCSGSLSSRDHRTLAPDTQPWAEDDGADYIFGLAGNTTLDALVAETADNLRFHHAKSSQTKLRTYASFTYQAGSWTRPRKVVAR